MRGLCRTKDEGLKPERRAGEDELSLPDLKTMRMNKVWEQMVWQRSSLK